MNPIPLNTMYWLAQEILPVVTYTPLQDMNLDGSIRYQGSGNDTNTIKDIILAHPDNQSTPSNLFIILEQLPEN